MTTAPPRRRKTPRRHQKTAYDAAVHTLRHGGRATIVSPCGTGKTFIACLIADELARSCHALRRLVLLPTLALLAQTVRAFQADCDHLGSVIAVCSPLDLDGVPTTTSPAELAHHLSGLDHYTVFATYASLTDTDGIQGALINAHRDQTIPPWDLVICDEAHRTSGSLNKAWAAVHDDTHLPATRRLYLTATPRIWDTDPRYAETLTPGDGPYLAASMDNEDLYGPTVFSMQLSQAIAEGLASDYRIVLVAVDHPTLQTQLRRTRNATHQDPLALISLATATLKTCATYQIRRLITFHKLVKDGQAFITTLRATADALHQETTDTAHGPVPLRPDTLWAECVHMGSPDRYDHIATFRDDGPLPDGRPADLKVLANARLLTEGVDIVSVDGLCFASPKSSVVDITQALGRALRPHPDTDKATLLVPIYLAPGEDPSDLLNSEAYQPLYDILLALRAHDLRIADRLPTTHLATPPDQPAPTPTDSEPPLPETPADPTDATDLFAPLGPDTGPPPFGAPGSPFPDIIGVDGAAISPRDIARVMDLRVLQPQGVTKAWMDSALDAIRFHDQFGHLSVTRELAAELDTDPHRVDLYTWLSNQRTARRRGELLQWQEHLLDNLGIHWEPRDEAREALITYAEECARKHGGLAVSSGYQAPDGHPVGRDLANQRGRAAKGTISPVILNALNSIDPWWNPPWDFAWQRHYQRAAHRHAQGQELAQPTDTRTYLQWLRDPGSGLVYDQRDLLRKIGLDPGAGISTT